MIELIPSDAEILDSKNNEYKILRKSEYDNINQIELQFNDMINGTTTWIDAINEIKAKYPKPTA